MTWLGYTHFLLAISALAIGAGQIAMPKGTPMHRRWGLLFVFVMLVSNTIVFGIYEDSSQPGIFHLLAIVSLATLVTAVALVRLPGVGTGRRIVHGHMMHWSYGGLVAAGLGQGATALGYPPWPVIAASFLIVAIVAARLDFSKMLDPR